MGEHARSSKLNVIGRSAVWLALLAVMLQMVASFGHVHARDVASGDALQFARGSAKSGLANTAVSHSQDADEDDALCPVCFAVSLAAHAFAPNTSPAAYPVTFDDAHYVGASASFEAPRIEHASFRSRAPPRLTAI